MSAEEFVKQLYDVFLRREWDVVEAILDPHLRYVSDGSAAMSRDALMHLLRNDDWQGHAITLHTMECTHDDHSAELHYHAHFHGERNGREQHFNAHETMRLVRNEASWKVVGWEVVNEV